MSLVLHVKCGREEICKYTEYHGVNSGGLRVGGIMHFLATILFLYTFCFCGEDKHAVLLQLGNKENEPHFIEK